MAPAEFRSVSHVGISAQVVAHCGFNRLVPHGEGARQHRPADLGVRVACQAAGISYPVYTPAVTIWAFLSQCPIARFVIVFSRAVGTVLCGL